MSSKNRCFKWVLGEHTELTLLLRMPESARMEVKWSAVEETASLLEDLEVLSGGRVEVVPRSGPHCIGLDAQSGLLVVVQAVGYEHGHSFGQHLVARSHLEVAALPPLELEEEEVVEHLGKAGGGKGKGTGDLDLPLLCKGKGASKSLFKP